MMRDVPGLPPKTSALYNIYHDSTHTVAPLYSKANVGLGLEMRDRIDELDEGIRQLFEIKLGFDHTTTAALVCHSFGRSSAVSSEFSFLLNDMFGEPAQFPITPVTDAIS
jgi:hypothetical protein